MYSVSVHIATERILARLFIKRYGRYKSVNHVIELLKCK